MQTGWLLLKIDRNLTSENPLSLLVETEFAHPDLFAWFEIEGIYPV